MFYLFLHQETSFTLTGQSFYINSVIRDLRQAERKVKDKDSTPEEAEKLRIRLFMLLMFAMVIQ